MYFSYSFSNWLWPEKEYAYLNQPKLYLQSILLSREKKQPPDICPEKSTAPVIYVFTQETLWHTLLSSHHNTNTPGRMLL